MKKLKMVWYSGGDWGFNAYAHVYWKDQNPNLEEPLFSIRGGKMRCFHNAKEDEKDKTAHDLATGLVNAWNEKVEGETR